MIAGEGTQVIRGSPQAIIAFVLDLEQYRQADTKITRVHWVRRQGPEMVRMKQLLESDVDPARGSLADPVLRAPPVS